jgi:hypothetical protein
VSEPRYVTNSAARSEATYPVVVVVVASGSVWSPKVGKSSSQRERNQVQIYATIMWVKGRATEREDTPEALVRCPARPLHLQRQLAVSQNPSPSLLPPPSPSPLPRVNRVEPLLCLRQPPEGIVWYRNRTLRQ